MKKWLCVLLSLVMCFSLSISFAQESTVGEADATVEEGILGIGLAGYFPFTDDYENSYKAFIGLGGFDLYIDAADIQAGEGVLEVHNSVDDSVITRADVKNLKSEVFQEENQTVFHVEWETPIMSSGVYYLTISEGTFTRDGRKSNEINRESNLFMEVLDCGWNCPTSNDIQVGQSIEHQYILGSAARVEIELQQDDAILEIDVNQLEKDGTVHVTALKEGECLMYSAFYDEKGELLTDGYNNYTVLP